MEPRDDLAGKGSGVPSCSAWNTVAATSSVMTAALTAASAVGPIVNTPWLLSRIAGDVPIPRPPAARCPRRR